MPRKKIGEILLQAGVIDEGALRSGLAEQARWGGPLGRILVDLRLVSEHDLVDALSQQLHVPAVDLDSITPPAEVLALIAAELAVDHTLIPFGREGKFLDVAMADPTNLGIVDEIRIRTQLNVRSHLAGPKAIERALARCYHRGAGMLDIAVQQSDGRLGAPPPGQEFTPRGAIDLGAPSDAEVRALQQRITHLEALVARDEDVLRKLLSLLVDKGIASREEILDRLR
jgi:type IV pilus assembly protein PilB